MEERWPQSEDDAAAAPPTGSGRGKGRLWGKQRFTPSSAMLLQSNLLHGHSHSLSALIMEQGHLPVCRRVGETICKC